MLLLLYIDSVLDCALVMSPAYGITNALIINAYTASDDPTQQRNNVIIALGVIRGLVAYWNAQSPF